MQNDFNSIFANNEGGESPALVFLPAENVEACVSSALQRQKGAVLFPSGRIEKIVKKWLKIWCLQKLMRLALLG
ncbi:MAG: hypothetical protein E7429_03080 [Ruminococcaceae bacterium]|nr:hypothetical protein [Oscillospiraceae bacterium]